MRCVTRQATLVSLHRSVFEDERAHGIDVALGANRELTSGSSHLVTGLRAMRIVAVTALDESHIDAVTIRPGKFGLLRSVAPVAQFSLRLY